MTLKRSFFLLLTIKGSKSHFKLMAGIVSCDVAASKPIPDQFQHLAGGQFWAVGFRLQDRFVRAYMESALALQGGRGLLASGSQEAALEEAVEQLKAACRAYLPVSHLLWGLWGLIQVHFP